MAEPRQINILIGASGGAGGGVLTNWLVDAIRANNMPVQATSIPGVAQRTGATTYYIELVAQAGYSHAGHRPIFGLYPRPGDVDLVIASELLEAGRAMENGFVNPDRTTLIAASHRLYTIDEKSATTEARFDNARIIKAANELSLRPYLYDAAHHPDAGTLALNAVLLGIVAGSSVLPLHQDDYRTAIVDSGVAVDSNLAGFDHGLAIANGDIPTQPPAPESRPTEFQLPRRLQADIDGLPEPSMPIVMQSAARLIDYQGVRYARRYIERVKSVAAFEPDGEDRFALTKETARHLALWMAYEDIVRVADLKTRSGRISRLRAEVGAGEDQPIRVQEYLKPGIEEVAALLPPFLGRWVVLWAERRGMLDRLRVPLRIKTTTVTGFTTLWLLARLRLLRPLGYRYAEEKRLIDRWLEAVRQAAARDYALACEIVECARLLKGYGDTRRRGWETFVTILNRAVEWALAGQLDAHGARAVREAALADPEGTGFSDKIEELRTQRANLAAAD